MLDPMDQIDNVNLAKYQMAGNIASKVLESLISSCVPNTAVCTLCVKGDNLIIEELTKVYPNIKNKGIAFPTCISLNNILGNYSPVNSNNILGYKEINDSSIIIKDGDIVKIELGVHIDGFPSCICHTILVEDKNFDNTDVKKNVMNAASEAAKRVLKNMKVGRTNKDIVRIIQEVADEYGCKTPRSNDFIKYPVPGLIIFQMSKNIIDGYNDEDKYEFVHRFIITDPILNESSVRELELEEDEVYAVDIVMSNGTGKITQSNYETTIYKKWQNYNHNQDFKLKASRNALNLMGRNPFPINSRNFADKTFKFGMKECVDKQRVEQYPVMMEKEGVYVARVKFTVVVKDKAVLLGGYGFKKN